VRGISHTTPDTMTRGPQGAPRRPRPHYCEGLDQVHKPVTCTPWDHVGLTGQGSGAAGQRAKRSSPLAGGDTPLIADGRRRLVAPAWEPATR
jgi:hypothetical protein